jgi:hypothetical protein
MHYKFIKVILTFFLLFSTHYANNLLVDTQFGYRNYLPQGFIRIIEIDGTHKILDTTSNTAYKSLLFISRSKIDRKDYPTDNDWIRTNFIATKLSTEYSTYFFADIFYFDSSKTVKHQTSWAPELYSRCYSADTNNFAWDEYIYYTAANGFGFEFMALGDTNELFNHLDDYVSILHNFILTTGLPQSSNYLLSNISIAPAVNLSRPFAGALTRYSSTVGKSISSLTITPNLDDPGASCKLNNVPITSSNPSQTVKLNLGKDTITIVVTAQDNKSIQWYDLIITRLDSDIGVKFYTTRFYIKNTNTKSIFDLKGRKYPSNQKIKKKTTSQMLVVRQNEINGKEIVLKKQ